MNRFLCGHKLLLTCKSSFYILDISSLKDIQFANLFSHSTDHLTPSQRHPASIEISKFEEVYFICFALCVFSLISKKALPNLRP